MFKGLNKIYKRKLTHYYTFYKFSLTTPTISKEDLSGKNVISLARNGKLLESMQLFNKIKSKNNNIGIKPAIKLINILIEQAELLNMQESELEPQFNSSLLIPLDFGYDIYRLLIDYRYIESESVLMICTLMFDLFKKYKYPSDKVQCMWIDIKKNNINDSNIIIKLMNCFIDKYELKIALDIFKWIINNKNILKGTNDDELYIKILNECVKQNEFEIGKYICQQYIENTNMKIETENINNINVNIICLCLNIYYKCNDKETVLEIWENNMKNKCEIKFIDSNILNIICKLYSENNLHYEKLMFLYEDMKNNNICIDKYTFISLINVCSNILNLDKGKEIHLNVSNNNILINNDFEILTCLLNMYSKCGDFMNTLKYWDDLKKYHNNLLNIQHYNCIINIHCQYGNINEILTIYKELKKNINPNEITYTMVIDVLNRKGMNDKLKEILREEIEFDNFGLDNINNDNILLEINK
eukprot:138356_1